MFKSKPTLFGRLLRDSLIHLGREPEIIILEEGNFSRVALMRQLAFLLHSSTEFLVVLFVQACKMTISAFVSWDSLTRRCTSSIEAPPLAITLVFFPLQNLRSFILLHIELLNIRILVLVSLGVVVGLLIGVDFTFFGVDDGADGLMIVEVILRGGGSCFSGVIKSILGAEGIATSSLR